MKKTIEVTCRIEVDMIDQDLFDGRPIYAPIILEEVKQKLCDLGDYNPRLEINSIKIYESDLLMYQFNRTEEERSKEFLNVMGDIAHIWRKSGLL